MTYRLRPYQETAVARVRAELAAGRRSCLIVAPTGAGKTVIACHIIESALGKNTKTLFVAHRKELIDQCAAKLAENGISYGFIKAGRAPSPYERVQIASVQTYDRRIDKLHQGYGLIIFDEAHRAAAKSYQKIVNRNPGSTILGLTATPYRTDGQGLGELFGSLVQVESTEALTAEGYLVPTRVFAGARISLRGVHLRSGDYRIDELAERMNRPRLVGNLLSAWLKYANGRTTVAFGSDVAHSQAIAAVFRASAIQAEHLNGNTPSDQRAAILRRLQNRETQIVSNYGVLTEGWDCPPCSAIILARPTKSRGLWKQMIGRCQRPCPEIEKRDCVILDHANCVAEHGYITDPDDVSLDGGLRAAKPAAEYRCRSCGAVAKSQPRYCPACGVDTQGPRQLAMNLATPTEVAIGWEMIEVRPETMPRRPRQPMPEEVAAMLYLRDMETAHERGYKPGWAAARYKARMQRWPEPSLKRQSPFRTRFARASNDSKMTEVWV